MPVKGVSEKRNVGKRSVCERCVGKRSPGEKECRMKEVSENWIPGERIVGENEPR
jgi:hypothetical protein